jgi:tRNA pseudouridine32 synthase / 23S rRNA pseudouridine746 synthase
MEILYLDQWLLVVNKPAGVLSIQDGYDLSAPHLRTLLEPEFGRCWIVHRLDKETSGAILLARTKEVHRLLNIMFESSQIKKEYRAAIQGIPPETHFDISLPLLVNADRHHRTRVNFEKGKPAKTSIQILSVKGNYALISAQPQTGYMHQIRAHLAHLHYPIIGDSLYQSIYPNEIIKSDFSNSQLALHSYLLEFVHPKTAELIRLVAKIPDFLVMNF